jgi:tetratricopeptide (TPR) repeat protein
MTSGSTTPWWAALALGLAAGLTPVLAADTPSKPGASAPDLTAVRAKIKAKEFKPAIIDLTALLDGGTIHPDIYSLLGFSYRKSGDRTNGALYYRKALDIDPWHKGALEYQGAMFVETGDIPKARANLAKLVQLCPSGCEEREDLEKDIKDAQVKKRK